MTGCVAVVNWWICRHVLLTIHNRFGRSVGEVAVKVVEILLHGIAIEKDGCRSRQVSRQTSHSWILRLGGGCGCLLRRVFSPHAANPLLTVIRQIQQSPSESLTVILELCQNPAGCAKTCWENMCWKRFIRWKEVLKIEKKKHPVSMRLQALIVQGLNSSFREEEFIVSWRCGLNTGAFLTEA